MIPAVVAEFQLERFASQRDAGKLMSEADSEDGLAAHEPPDVVDRVGAGLRIAGTIRQEHSVGLQREHIFCSRLRRDNRYLAPLSAKFSQDILLDAKVIGHDVKAGG